MVPGNILRALGHHHKSMLPVQNTKTCNNIIKFTLVIRFPSYSVSSDSLPSKDIILSSRRTGRGTGHLYTQQTPIQLVDFAAKVIHMIAFNITNVMNTVGDKSYSNLTLYRQATF
jgi:hypothetical protein